MKRIGIMGGTFDPVHNGHLLIAENACEQLSLDEVRFIPTGRSPHKQGRSITDASHRMRMVEIAIADNPAFLPLKFCFLILFNSWHSFLSS